MLHILPFTLEKRGWTNGQPPESVAVEELQEAKKMRSSEEMSVSLTEPGRLCTSTAL